MHRRFTRDLSWFCGLSYDCSGDLIMLIMKCGIDPKLTCYVGVRANSKIRRCTGYWQFLYYFLYYFITSKTAHTATKLKRILNRDAKSGRVGACSPSLFKRPMRSHNSDDDITELASFGPIATVVTRHDERLQMLLVDSLEHRWLCFDLLCFCELFFSLARVDGSDLFEVRLTVTRKHLGLY